MTDVHKTINPEKKAEDETTDIICVLDRSTSIRTSGLIEKTIEGFNSFLADQKKAIGKAKLTLCLFDGGTGGAHGSVPGKTYEIIHDRVDIQSVPELNTTTFSPRGMTALFDALGSTLDAVYNKWKNSDERPDKVIFLIMTDGEENSSKEYDQKTVFDMIKKHQVEDKFVFLFIGANIDTMKAGGSLGISKGNTMSYTGSDRGVNSAFTNMSSSVSNLRAKMSSSATYSVEADSLLADNGEEKEKI